MKNLSKTLFFISFFSLALSLQAKAALIGCNSGEEHSFSLAVKADQTGRCQSGLSAQDGGWSYWHCISNETGNSIQPGYYNSCYRYENLGNGYGIVHLKAAEDARWR